ncbi:hypothetical protein GRI97_17825 [Altererythrobacter xixiisoli]|uniref:SWIM-type domain-containing protein n=1 Tax=Croceibacterium xixiisoli TaxID=1476466 RepID=A0A6I4TZT9_9SPHN|nr:hypothetical protein [Croceibacterium xixiisoli]MXP00851.1 hypothetical protein [Croceibacterium xixiisoli]
MIGPELRQSLASFDDAALATLANPGLVRRARRDLTDGKVRLVSAEADKAEIEADGQLVVIDKRGPRAAQCACKSIEVCRHRIAAVMLIQSAEADAPEPEAQGDPRDIAEAFDPAALERWAGRPSWRAALEILPGAGTITAQANAIGVNFEGLDDEVRILRGQGADGIVSKAPKAQKKAYHAAAVLAARAHFGLTVPDAITVEEVGDTATSLQIDPAFLDHVGKALGEVVTVGFNLAPLPLEESLFEISVSSRADSLPRLSSMLRGIAAQLRLRRRRSVSFDPDGMLELAASAFALTQALKQEQGGRQITLAGKVRRDFTPAPPLALVGCGGEQWRSVGGARGVTAWFCEVETGRWLSTTLARGAGQDPQFTPAIAWRQFPVWQAAPLTELAHASFSLEGANISAEGRLSAPATARAMIGARAQVPLAEWSVAIHDWDELHPLFLRTAGLGLDAGTAPVACLLAPSHCAAPYFDDFAQQLVWPIRDRAGNWLALTIDNEEPVATAIEALEATVRHGWNGAVLAKIMRDGDRLSVVPITLCGNGSTVDLTLWQRPYRDDRKSSWRDWLQKLAPRSAQAFRAVPAEDTKRILTAAWRALMDRAEAGPGLAGTLENGLIQHGSRLDSYGLPVLAEKLRQAQTPAGVLTAAYGLLVARQQRSRLPFLFQT